MSAHWHTREDATIWLNGKLFSEGFTRLTIISLIAFHSVCDQMMLHKESRDYVGFETTRGMYSSIRLVQGAINLASAFVRVSWKILNPHLGSLVNRFVDNVRVKGPKS